MNWTIKQDYESYGMIVPTQDHFQFFFRRAGLILDSVLAVSFNIYFLRMQQNLDFLFLLSLLGKWLPPDETTLDDFPEPSVSLASNDVADEMSYGNDRLTRRNRFVSGCPASSSACGSNAFS